MKMKGSWIGNKPMASKEYVGGDGATLTCDGHDLIDRSSKNRHTFQPSTGVSFEERLKEVGTIITQNIGRSQTAKE